MTYFERTYAGLRESLERALAPGHFPVFTRAKNPNRLQGTRTGLTLDALTPYGAVDVSLWRPEDVRAAAKTSINLALGAGLTELQNETYTFPVVSTGVFLSTMTLEYFGFFEAQTPVFVTATSTAAGTTILGPTVLGFPRWSTLFTGRMI